MNDKTQQSQPDRPGDKRAANALVTGGSRRIGAAIVEDLARHGFNVCIHYASSDDEADDLAESLSGLGVRITTAQADLNSLDETRAMFRKATSELGPISLLVNNASVFEPDSADALDETIWDQHFNVHLKAPMHLASAMYAQSAIKANHNSGLIVNIIDQRVWQLTPGFFSYTLSKSALWTATQTLAQSFAPHIRVNAIGPGPTLANERQEQADFQAQVDAILLKNGPGLGDFGETIRYFWNSRSVTGQMLALDGGQHLAWETPDVTAGKE